MRYDIAVHAATQTVVLRLSVNGTRTVSRKRYRSGKDVPVLDINSRIELSALQDCVEVKAVFRFGYVILCPLASERRRRLRLERLHRKLVRGESLRTAGVCAGGGVLSHALHKGLEDASLPSELALFNELRPDLVDQAVEHHELLTSATCVVQLPLQELAFDDDTLRVVGEVDLLEVGLPCSGASIAGRAKRRLTLPEEHPLIGHLVAAALALVARLNPVACLFENVVPYASSASAAILRQQLRDLGYTVHERELFGPDFGELEARRRWCLLAVTQGIGFDWALLETSAPTQRRLGDVLEPADAEHHRWDTMAGLRAKQSRDRAAGKGFKMQVFSAESCVIGTLTKGLSKNRSTDPKISHPQDPLLLRVPSVAEHARVKGVPEHLVAGMSHTKGHELLGQSVVYQPFRQVAKALGRALTLWQAAGANSSPTRAVKPSGVGVG